jgi:hypothetical protein
VQKRPVPEAYQLTTSLHPREMPLGKPAGTREADNLEELRLPARDEKKVISA